MNGEIYVKNSKILTASVVGSLAVLLSGCGGPATGSASSATVSSSESSEASSNASDSSDANSSTSDSNDSGSSFEDGTLVTPDMKIVIIDHKTIAVGEKGNEYGEKPVIAFWYKITNLSDKDVTPLDFITTFTAYQDNNPNAENQLEVGSLPDDRFLDSQMENVKKGGTVENAMAYELDDETTPVDLVASNDLGMSELGKASYTLK